MKRTPKAYLIILLFTIALPSCKSPKTDDSELYSEGTKMYFIDLRYDSQNIDTCYFTEKYKNFYIDDAELINAFDNEFKKNKSRTKHQNSFCYYGLQIIDEGEIKYGAYLDVKNKHLIESSYYEFDLEKFESYSDKFKKLDAYSINCNSLKQMKKLLIKLKAKGVYIFGSDYFLKEKRILDFNGTMTLSYKSTNSDKVSEWEETEKKIKKDFRDIDRIEILYYTSTSTEIEELNILCTRDLTNELPSGYQLNIAYSDSINLPFNVYDFSKENINELIKEANISRVKIVDLNE